MWIIYTSVLYHNFVTASPPPYTGRGSPGCARPACGSGNEDAGAGSGAGEKDIEKEKVKGKEKENEEKNKKTDEEGREDTPSNINKTQHNLQSHQSD